MNTKVEVSLFSAAAVVNFLLDLCCDLYMQLYYILIYKLIKCDVVNRFPALITDYRFLTSHHVYENGYYILFKKTVLYVINRTINTCILGNARFISRLEHDISLVRCPHS